MFLTNAMATPHRLRLLCVAVLWTPMFTSCLATGGATPLAPPIAVAEASFRDHADIGYEIDVTGIYREQDGEKFLFGVMHTKRGEAPPAAGDFMGIPEDEWEEVKDRWFGNPRATRELDSVPASGHLNVYMILWRLKPGQGYQEFRYCGSMPITEGIANKEPYIIELGHCP